MIVQPVLHPLLLVLLCTPVAAAIVVALVRPSRRGGAPVPWWLWALRMLMLAAVFVMLLRPGIPGGTSQTLSTDTDVVVVVDTTASIAAEDWAGGDQRLDGVRADVQALVDEYPGARFAMITFDANAQLRLPLTTDTTAVISSLDVLRPEVTAQSRGSSIGVANTLLADTLEATATSSPDRSRMVFYLGDGEQTVAGAPESFRAAAEYVDAGAVLGYGTAEGGRMRITTGTGEADAGYIEYQGEPARSVIDETNLQAIAADLGVEYQRRSADVAIELPDAPTTTTDFASSGEIGNVIELYWVFALLIVVLLGVELARAAMLVARMRGLAAPASSALPAYVGEAPVLRTDPPGTSEEPASARRTHAGIRTPTGGAS